MRTGIDARTGKVLTDWDHVVQSIGRCLRRRFNSTPFRRHLGSEVPEMQDASAGPTVIFKMFSAIATALTDEQGGEPGFRLTRIEVITAARKGRFIFILTGDHFPLGHLGDFTTREVRTLQWPEDIAT